MNNEDSCSLGINGMSFGQRLNILLAGIDAGDTSIDQDYVADFENPSTLSNVDVANVMCRQLKIDIDKACLLYSSDYIIPRKPTNSRVLDDSPTTFRLSFKSENDTSLRLCQGLVTALCSREIGTGVQRISTYSNVIISSEYLLNFYISSVMKDLCGIAKDSFIYEMSLASAEGYISSSSSEDVFRGAEMLSADSEYLAYFLNKYPVLVARLRNRLPLITQSIELLIGRLVSDISTISEKLGCNLTDLTVVEICRGQGDSHAGAESVSILRFSNEMRVVYKPRCISPEAALNKMLAWLTEKDSSLKQVMPWTVQGVGYGWMEFIEQRPVSAINQVEAYHFRYGALMAAMYALNGTDIHHENLVAHGEYPVVVDAETIFQPILLSSDDPEDRSYVLDLEFYADSPLYTAMVDPSELSRELGGSPLNALIDSHEPLEILRGEGQGDLKLHQADSLSGGPNNVVLGDVVIDGHAYRKEILAGFCAAYNILLANKNELVATTIDAISEDVRIRVIFKPTSKYSKIVNALASPYASETIANQDEYLLKLWIPVIHKPALAGVVLSEADDLWNADIPYFSAMANATTIYDSNGYAIEGVIPKTGLETTKSKLARLSSATLQVDFGVLDYFLRRKERNLNRPKKSTTDSDDSLLFGSNPQRILTLIKDNIFIDEGSLHFVDLVIKQDLSTAHAPLPEDLYSGLAGLCLTYAHYGHATNNFDILDFARRISSIHFSSINTASVEKIGICQGLGGSIYLASHLIATLKDDYYRTMGLELSQTVRGLIYTDRKFDVFSGTAGTILALVSLHEATKDTSVLRTIEVAVAHLERHCQLLSDGSALWMSSIPSSGPTSGFAHGMSGIGYALLRARTYLGGARLDNLIDGVAKFLSACKRGSGIWSEDSSDEAPSNLDVWCHGSMGISIFFELYARTYQSLSADTLFREAFAHMTTKILYENDSACHGTLGNLDILLFAKQSPRWVDLRPVADSIIDEVKLDLSGRNLLCGNKYKHHSVSLFNGFCGMAYQLARCDMPEQIPSFLRFDGPASLQ